MNVVAPNSLPDTSPSMSRLVLVNETEELATLGEWISEVASEHSLPAKTAFALDMALTEAVTNVLNYAFSDEEQHELVVTILPMETAISAEIRDDGQPFDPLNYAPVQLPTSLDEAGVGGLGIHLIRSYASECRYRRENDHNILTLTFSLADA